MSYRIENEAFRQSLPECFLPASFVEHHLDRVDFLQRIENIPVSDEALLEFQRHALFRMRAPEEPFHKHFPLSLQVNSCECTASLVYTQGTGFADRMNRLFQCKNRDALFEQYGRCMKALRSYTEKMQAAYGQVSTLYRGRPGSWARARGRYRVGTTFFWASFASTSKDFHKACCFAHMGSEEEDARPILFLVYTLSRGAPLYEWSAYPHEGEVLLQPFQQYCVEDVSVEGGVLMIRLSTIMPMSMVAGGPRSSLHCQDQSFPRRELSSEVRGTSLPVEPLCRAFMSSGFVVSLYSILVIIFWALAN